MYKISLTFYWEASCCRWSKCLQAWCYFNGIDQCCEDSLTVFSFNAQVSWFVFGFSGYQWKSLLLTCLILSSEKSRPMGSGCHCICSKILCNFHPGVFLFENYTLAGGFWWMKSLAFLSRLQICKPDHTWESVCIISGIEPTRYLCYTGIYHCTV